MRTCLPFVALLCLACASATAAEAPQGPANDVPELEVLNHWVGAWDDDMTFKPNAGLPQGMHAKGVVNAEWILDGRFVQQTSTVTPDDGSPATKVMMLMTYDPQKNAYRSWMYYSWGGVREVEGQWDEKSRTMTSIGKDADSGATMTIKATFAEDGAENWNIIDKDRDGNVLIEISGKNTPRKK